MKLNGIEIYEVMGDKKKYLPPLLSAGERIRLLYDDENLRLPGSRVMKKGTYSVIDVHDSFVVRNSMTYDLVKSGAKYVFVYNTIIIDKAIVLGLIERIK